MKYLGKIHSPGGVAKLHVSMVDRLRASELLTGTPTVTTTETGVAISGVTRNTTAIVDQDSNASAIDQAVEFIVTTTKVVTADTEVEIFVEYSTDQSNTDKVKAILLLTPAALSG